jgi:hypothetical protein
MSGDNVVIDPATAAKTIVQLTARIETLEQSLLHARERPQESIGDGMVAVLNTLRARGVVLLNVGEGRAYELREALQFVGAGRILTSK